MTKPHEDELVLSTQGTQPALVAWSDGRMVCAFREQASDDWRTLLQAAPNMARTLLAVLEREKGSDLRFTLGTGILEDIRAALTKAGMPLP